MKISLALCCAQERRDGTGINPPVEISPKADEILH
jgi:hypothetical protein